MNFEKARDALSFTGVLFRDERGRPTVLQTPAQTRFEGFRRGRPRIAQVTIQRPSDDQMVMTCRHYDSASDSDEGSPCPASQGTTVCYHCLASLLAIAGEADCFINAHPHKDAATAELGSRRGRILAVRSGTAEAFICLIPRKPILPAAKSAEVPTVKPIVPLALFDASNGQPPATTKRKRKAK